VQRQARVIVLSIVNGIQTVRVELDS
jgi:hypothetical protein